MIQGFGGISISLGLAAVGSALGTGAAGMAAVGAWKKALSQGKPAPFILTSFVGAPLTQTIYGFIVHNTIVSKGYPADTSTYILQAVMELFAGLAIGASAYMQGKAGAAAADAYVETNGKGFGNYMIVIGITETVALFVLAFCMISLPKVGV